MDEELKLHLRVVSMMHEALGNIIKEFHKGKINKRELSSELLACVTELDSRAMAIDKGLVK